MGYIIQVPSYYQTSSYPILLPKFPTTTAPFWIIRSDTVQGQAVGESAQNWGWEITYFDVDKLERSKRVLLYNVVCDPKYPGWQKDLWRIYQREHGLRILKRDEDTIRHRLVNKSRVHLAICRVKDVGRWFRETTSLTGNIERQLRGLEGTKTRIRLGERGLLTEDSPFSVNASTMSLPASFTERLSTLKLERRASDPSLRSPLSARISDQESRGDQVI